MENEDQNKNMTETARQQNILGRYPTASKVAIVIAGIVLILAIVWFMAARSLPGSMLYPLKTGFFETLDSSVQLSNEGKADHHIQLLNNRLEELKALISREQISEQALEDLRGQIELNTQGIYAALEAGGEDNLQSQNALRILEDLIGITSAMEVIGESDERFGEFGEFMEDARREASNTYSDRVDRFVERELPDVIYEFVKAQLTRVSHALESDTLSEEVIDDAEVYINRVAPSMSEGDLPRAINAIAEALRFIRIETLGANQIAESFQDSPEEEVPNTGTSTEDVATSSTQTPPTQEPPTSSSFQFAP